MKAQQHKRGSAIVTVMVFAAILLITAGSLHTMTQNAAFTVSNFRRHAEALNVAEAGIQDMLSKLSRQYDDYSSGTYTNTIGGVTYVVNVVSNGQTGCILTSTATVEGRSVDTVVESLGKWVTGWDTNTFGQWGIVSDGFLDVNGGGTLYAGLYCNDSVAIAPGCEVKGTVNAVGDVDNDGTIGGETNAGAAETEIPTFDFDFFLALAGGYYLYDTSVQPVDFKSNNRWQYSNSVGEASGLWTSPAANGDVYAPTPSPAGYDIICVKDSVLIQNGAVIYGSIIATGEINMQGGHVDHTAADTTLGYSPLPSLMSFGDYVKVCSGQELEGFIYCEGDVELNGGDVVTGGIICGGQFTGRNDWKVYPGPGTIPPGINPSGAGEVTEVRIGAWLR